jgi:hypothetical protein
LPDKACPPDAGRGGRRGNSDAVSILSRGIQNAAARRLAVPNLTTTVLTMTITGVAADLRAAFGGGESGRPGRASAPTRRPAGWRAFPARKG